MTRVLSWVRPNRQRNKHKADEVSIALQSTPVAEMDAGPVQPLLPSPYMELSPHLYPPQVFQPDPKPAPDGTLHTDIRTQSEESSQLAALTHSGWLSTTGLRSPPPPYSVGDPSVYISPPLSPNSPTHIAHCQADPKTKRTKDRVVQIYAELNAKPLPRPPSNVLGKVELLDQESLEQEQSCVSLTRNASARSCSSRASSRIHCLTIDTSLANVSGNSSFRGSAPPKSKSTESSPSSSLVSRYSPWYTMVKPAQLWPSKTLKHCVSTPVTLFQSDREIWIFPNVTPTQALARLSRGISRSNGTVVSLEELTDTGGQGRASGQPSASSSSTTTPVSASTSGPPSAGKGNKRRRRSGGRDDENPKHLRTQLCQDECESRPLPRYGCPFAKRSPARYQNVYNSCTFPPGKDWKYLIEHLTKVHRMSPKCIYCQQRWTRNWEEEVVAHLQVCPKRHTIMSKPEYMTAAQEAVYNVSSGDDSHPDKKWTMLFMRLWPGEYPIPHPWYDYFIARHELITPANSMTPNSDSSFEDSLYPRLRTWRIYSRNGTESNSSGPSEPSPNLPVQNASSPQQLAPAAASVPLINPMLPMASSPLDVPANYLNGGLLSLPWSQDMLVDVNQSIYELGDPSMAGSGEIFFYPPLGVTGEDHLDTWAGQAMGSMALL